MRLKIQPNALRALALDLDGTLVDTLGDFHAALNAMLEDLSLPAIARPSVVHMIGKGSEHLLRSVLAHVVAQGGLQADPEALYAAAWGHYMRHYEAINGRHAELYPGVLAGLQALHSQGWPLACVTNKPHAFARELLLRKGLAGFFVELAGGDSYACKKPHPQPLLETARKLGVGCAALLMVGDSENDAQAARAAGCPVLLLPYGYSHGVAVQSLDSDGVLPDVLQLAQFLGRCKDGPGLR
jgi:phosphoglycolate phosphatase